MKKVYLTLLSAIMTVMLLTSCNWENPSEAEKNPLSSNGNPWGKSWFSGDKEYQFISTEKGKFIRYLPDSLETSFYFEVIEELESLKTVTVKTLYSDESVRKVGEISSFCWNINKERLSLSSEKSLFNISNLETYEGTDPSTFEIPEIKTVYLSNFDGNFTFNENNWKFQVKSKISVEQDVNHSWFAHVVDVQENDGVYDFLLCHTSNADTGITGQEPFITNQATVWSWMKLSTLENNKTKVEWSNVWTATPAEALALPLNESYTIDFNVKGITCTYNFYFGNPVKKSDYECEVEKGDLIKKYVIKTNVPKNYTWKTLLEEANLDIKILEGKTKGKWWYLYSNAVKSENVSLNDSTKIDWSEQTFYLELEDKPDEADVYLRDGTYIFNTKYKIIIDSNDKTITYSDSSEENPVNKTFNVKNGKIYSTVSSNGMPLVTMYYVSDSEGTLYYFRIDYYVNNGSATYIKAYQIPYVKIDEEEDFRENASAYSFSGKIKSYTEAK